MTSSRRVVVTGMGAVTSLGMSVNETWQQLVSAQSGLRTIDRFDTSGFATTFAGLVPDTDHDSPHPRWVEFALDAAREAIAQAGTGAIADPARTAVLMGTALGSIEPVETGLRAGKPVWMTSTAAADAIATETGVTGPVLTYAASFAGSANAIGEAMTMIRTGRIDTAIAGGAESAITPSIIAGFIAMGATSQRNDDPVHAVRPFAGDRDGCAIGEGSAMLVLEDRDRALARNATILAELVGYGATADAYHVVALPEHGDALVQAMRIALRQAGIAPEQVGYINAHGTGTTMNDLVETAAIRDVFGATQIPVSSTKPATGHLLGAAGALEAVIGIRVLTHRMIPPTLNLHVRDPACDLDYVPNLTRQADPDYVMSNSMGFGGHATSLIFRRV